MTLRQRIRAIRARVLAYFNFKTTKILPLGASRVDADGDYESYRYYLYAKFKSNKNKITFLGTETDTKKYPRLSYLGWPNKHFGFGGISIRNLKRRLKNNIYFFDKPDIVLFSSPGGNDFANGVPYNQVILEIRNIIDILQERNPKAKIVIEKMARPAPKLVDSNYLQLEPIFFADLDSIAKEKSNDKSKVITIDMATGFDNKTMLFGYVHYNKIGARFIAQKYFNLIKTTI